MSKPKSSQLRELIVNSIDQGMSISEAVETYQIARRTVYYYLQRRKASTGAAAPVANRGPRSKLEDYRGQILRALQSNPDLTVKELCELLKLPVSPSTLSRTLAKWNGTPWRRSR
jgi:transposase